jgi:uncharacterized DUF497 family protein
MDFSDVNGGWRNIGYRFPKWLAFQRRQLLQPIWAMRIISAQKTSLRHVASFFAAQSRVLASYVHCQYTAIVRIQYELQGVRFDSESDKADFNIQKHGVSFHTACEVFFDPFVRLSDASNPSESREAALGYTEGQQLLFIVHVVRHEEIIRIISAREATREERRQYENP